jgi:hypothetical protein
MQAERYAGRLRYLAGITMEDSTVLTDTEKQLIPKLVDTFMAETLNGQMHFSIQMLPIQTLLQENGDERDFLSLIPRQELIDWVANYKEKKGKDIRRDGSTRSDSDIAQRVAFAIEANPEPWLSSTNPTGLRMVTGLTGLSPAKVSSLLQDVLRVWSEYMRENLPGAVARELRAAFV